MKKRNLLILIITFLAVTTSTVKTYAEEVEQAIILSVQPFVSVTKQTGSIDAVSANGSTGTHSGLQTIYNIQTNGTDSDYDFTLKAYINTNDGPVSAYGNNGILLFGHALAYPTAEAINDAKIGGHNNRNVIAYPTTTTTTTPMTSVYTPNYGAYGDCYVIKLNNGTDTTNGTFTHSVSGSPVAGTYNIGQDQSGFYQATIVLTVTPKG